MQWATQLERSRDGSTYEPVSPHRAFISSYTQTIPRIHTHFIVYICLVYQRKKNVAHCSERDLKEMSQFKIDVVTLAL